MQPFRMKIHFFGQRRKKQLENHRCKFGPQKIEPKTQADLVGQTYVQYIKPRQSNSFHNSFALSLALSVTLFLP